MKFKTERKVENLKLKDITIEGVIVDNSYKSLLLKDTIGNVILIECQYGCHVSIPEPPKKVKKYFVVGSVAGANFEFGPFDNEYEAGNKRSEIPTPVHAEVVEREVDENT